MEENETPGAWAQRVLVVMAHPDDAEFSSGGTLAKWAKEGKKIEYVLFTRGDKGTSDPEMTSERLAQIREQEQRAAAVVLGVKDVHFLGWPDGGVEDGWEGRGQVVRHLRRFKPDIVVTMDPQRRYRQHRDHRNAGTMALDASFPYARDHLFYPEHKAEGLETHHVGEVFVAGAEEPDVFIDIQDTFDLKIDALRCHKSQVGDGPREAFIERVRNMGARMMGKLPEGYDPGTTEVFRRVDYRRR
ncbi:MAG: PIG-L family deacetylase [Dehalococcoidia bacterium]|nr:PIG-L family deacetylase [Dehalococcoidia bacterium]